MKIGKDKIKHAAISFVAAIFVGMLGAIYGGCCAEQKDKDWGGYIDMGDIIADIIGAIPGGLIHMWLMYQCWGVVVFP